MFLGFLKECIGEFLSCHEEWHASLIGFAEGFIPWIPTYAISEDLEEEVNNDFHYYVSAMVAGFILRIFAIVGVIVWGLSRIIPLFIGG